MVSPASVSPGKTTFVMAVQARFSIFLTCETVVEDGDILLIKAGAAKA